MPNIIEVKQLTKDYDAYAKALAGVDLTIDHAGIFALLGPNGSGKTTLMRILTTQFRPSSGLALVFGYDVVREDRMVRKMIGYVPQEMSVWADITGYENLLIYAKIYGVHSEKREKNIWEALQIMGLDEVANRQVKKYSGGMVRRLEIACAMLIKPKILFLDEPTLGLDPSARKAVWENLRSFKKEHEASVFFNTHYMDEADLYSDEAAIISKGRIIKSGTTNELKHSLQSELISISLSMPGANSQLSPCETSLNPGLQTRILDKIRNLNYVFNANICCSVLHISVEDSETSLPCIIEVLINEGIRMERISTARPTLDDVFLKYAGKSYTKGGEKEAS